MSLAGLGRTTEESPAERIQRRSGVRGALVPDTSYPSGHARKLSNGTGQSGLSLDLEKSKCCVDLDLGAGYRQLSQLWELGTLAHRVGYSCSSACWKSSLFCVLGVSGLSLSHLIGVLEVLPMLL